jgi:hypothetical protein
MSLLYHIFSDENLTRINFIRHACCIFLPSRPPLFDYCNNTSSLIITFIVSVNDESILLQKEKIWKLTNIERP